MIKLHRINISNVFNKAVS